MSVPALPDMWYFVCLLNLKNLPLPPRGISQFWGNLHTTECPYLWVYVHAGVHPEARREWGIVLYHSSPNLWAGSLCESEASIFSGGLEASKPQIQSWLQVFVGTQLAMSVLESEFWSSRHCNQNYLYLSHLSSCNFCHCDNQFPMTREESGE